MSEDVLTIQNMHQSQDYSSPLSKGMETKLNQEWIIAALLAFFAGTLGIHRFYVGKIGTGILMILTFGGFGIWSLIDFIMIILGKFEKEDGTILTMWIPA